MAGGGGVRTGIQDQARSGVGSVLNDFLTKIHAMIGERTDKSEKGTP